MQVEGSEGDGRHGVSLRHDRSRNLGSRTAIVDEATPRWRIDRYATESFAEVASRKQARKWIKEGAITLNGLPVESSRFVRPGDVVALAPPTEAPGRLWRMPIEVVHADPWLAVVVKPAGLPVRGVAHRTLRNALPAHLPVSDRPLALPAPEPVHRLDIRTWGLVLVARTSGALVALGQSFEERRIHKRYRALALGRLEGEHEVSEPIDGREAHTRLAAVGHSRSLHTGWFTHVDLWPSTGRTHQLRRHLAGLGHPILGDDLYTRGKVLRGQGLFLAAIELAFEHPVTGEQVAVCVEPPEKFGSFVRREERRWQTASEAGVRTC